jgi:hypothetical protein
LKCLWGIWGEDSQIRTHQGHQPGLLQDKRERYVVLKMERKTKVLTKRDVVHTRIECCTVALTERDVVHTGTEFCRL